MLLMTAVFSNTLLTLCPQNALVASMLSIKGSLGPLHNNNNSRPFHNTSYYLTFLGTSPLFVIAIFPVEVGF